MTYRIGVIRGDGTGPEVVGEGLKVLDTVRDGFDVELVDFDLGADRYLRTADVLPEGPLAPDSTAVTAAGWWYEDRLSETIIPGEALLPGTNVLGVELRQHDPASSDLYFTLELAHGAQ